jgi:hypothetical protein
LIEDYKNQLIVDGEKESNFTMSGDKIFTSSKEDGLLRGNSTP